MQVFDKRQILLIAIELINKTKGGNVKWQFKSEDKYVSVVIVDDYVYVIKAVHKADIAYIVLVVGPEGVIGQTDLAKDDPDTNTINHLYEMAVKSTVDKLFAKFMSVLANTTSVGQKDLNTAKIEKYVNEVDNRDFKAIHGRLAGGWLFVEAGKKPEYYLIDFDGKVFVAGSKKPQFTIRVIAANDASDKIEIAKFNNETGQVVQLESLQLGKSIIVGNIKHDNTPVRYERRVGS